MILLNESIEVLCKRIKREGKRLVCFGAGLTLKSQKYINVKSDVYKILDNKATSFNCDTVTIPVYTLEQFLSEEQYFDDIVILITILDFFDVFEQLNSQSQLKDVLCYIFHFVQHIPMFYDLPKPLGGEMPKIPKKIHYIWFGGKEIPDKNKKWMESWNKYCPDYEIVRWDEKNYDVSQSEYMYSAYQSELYAFASDYARLDIVFKYGGIYLDTDVELLCSLDDLLYDEAFFGRSYSSVVASGLGFGAIRGSNIIKSILNSYIDIYPNPQNDNGLFETNVFQIHGFNKPNSLLKINGVALYPTDVFSPSDWYGNLLAFTKNTHSIHHFDSSWYENSRLNKRIKDSNSFAKFIGKYLK